MIVDYKTASKNITTAYSVFDRDTGECLDDMMIFYADDEHGIIRYYVKDEDGFLIADGNQIRTASETRNIRIVENPGV